MYGYIYLTINNINQKRYIGRHKHSTFDPNYIGSGVALQAAIKKYGKENFSCSILEPIDNVNTECASEEELMFAEAYYTKIYNVVESKDFYNLVEGGAGSFPVFKSAWNKGLTAKTDERVAKYISNKQKTDSIRNQKLHQLKIETICNSTPFKTYYFSHTHTETCKYYHIKNYELYECLNYCSISKIEIQEHLDNIRKAQFSSEVRNKMSLKKSKKVLCIETGEVFNKVIDATKIYGQHINDVANGKRKTAGGYHWQWID